MTQPRDSKGRFISAEEARRLDRDHNRRSFNASPDNHTAREKHKTRTEIKIVACVAGAVLALTGIAVCLMIGDA